MSDWERVRSGVPQGSVLFGFNWGEYGVWWKVTCVAYK